MFLYNVSSPYLLLVFGDDRMRYTGVNGVVGSDGVA